MKNQILNRIFIAVFLVLCLIPSAGMLLFGPSKASANEILASKPKLTNRDGGLNGGVLTETADYIGDRYYLRQELITAWSKLNTSLFFSSPDDSVLMGKSGCLYYTETLDDYSGLALEDGKLLSAGRNLMLMQEYVNSQGAEFLFTVAPNKNSLYPKYMPDGYENFHSEANAGKLKNILLSAGVGYADLFRTFADENRMLYYKTDSHWTSEGAALAADSLLSALGKGSGYYAGSFTSGEQHRGDLYEMLYPSGTLTEADSVPVRSFTYETAANPNGGEAMTIETTCASGEGHLLCWRDSFGVALYPYLAESFETATFLRASSYDLTRINGEDTVIIELVERNIDWLVKNAPKFPAPVRKLQPASLTAGAVPVSVGEPEGDLVKITAELTGDRYDFGGSIYFTVGSDIYEGCVLYPEDADSALVYAWIPAAAQGDICVLCPCGGVLTEYNPE